MTLYRRWNNAIVEHFFNSDMAGYHRLARARALIGGSGLMRAPKRQSHRQVCHFALALLEVDSNLRRARGFQHSLARIVDPRPPWRQAQYGRHTVNWEER